jgi:hypothetical protein
VERLFIVGCHRSGTTMMRLVLNSHPDIHCYDEWKSYRAIESGIYPPVDKEVKAYGFKIPNWTERLVHDPVRRLYYKDGDLIVFMIRDVRDVVASMLSLPTGAGNFFIHATNAIQNWYKDPARGCTKEFFEELTATETLSEPIYRKAALFWRYKTSQYLEMVKLGYRVLPIRYENIVTCPESCMRIICSVVGLPFSEQVLHHHQIEHDETPNGKAVGDTNVKRSIDTYSINKWKTVLTSSQESAVIETAGPLNDYMAFVGMEVKHDNSVRTKN